MADFRNYRRQEVRFGPGLNLVSGKNAQGKTNLLEAVFCLSGLGSPRSPDAALVREGAERALLHADVTRGARTVQIDLEFRPNRGTRALVNKTPVPSLRALGESVVSVFFGPDELSLVKGSPEGRRRFLDDAVVKLRPARDGLRKDWERVLKQRNALLKSSPARSGGRAPATLDVWDGSFVRAGAALTAARLEVLGALLPFAQERYRAIAGAGHLELEVQSAWIPQEVALGASSISAPAVEPVLEAALAEAVASIRPRELERGMSLVGPQRDDVAVRLTSTGSALLDARTFASQGEQRTSALALKLGEYDLLRTALGDEPVLLLDDVFSELDPGRRAWLSNAVRSAGQTLLSSAEPGAVEAAGAGQVIEVCAGELVARD